MRIVLIGFIIVLLVLSCGLAVKYGQDAGYAMDELNTERYKRMVAEEGLQKANNRISTLNTEVQRVQDQFKSTEQVLIKTKELHENVKNQLDQAVQLRKACEQQITELQQLGAPL